MEKNIYLGFRVGVIWGSWKRTWKLLFRDLGLKGLKLYRNNGEENGNYYLGFRVGAIQG